MGTFAVRCVATDRVWVGASRNLDAEKNGCWFCLRLGSHLEKSLQQEWNSQGESGFEFEILEKLEEEVHPLQLPDLLKTKKSQWISRLNAHSCL